MLQCAHMNKNMAQQDTQSPQSPASSSPQSSFFVELVKFALIALVIVLPFRLFIAQPFIVSGASMHPTFENGDYLIVDEISYRFEEPQRGDVVIFKYPNDPSKFFIKRIVGLPNETLHITNSQVYITSDMYPESVVIDEPYIDVPTSTHAPVTLSDTEYFVLGDNRAQSSDSRIWGPLDRDLIIGRAFLRLLPVSEADLFPGYHETQSQSIEIEN